MRIVDDDFTRLAIQPWYRRSFGVPAKQVDLLIDSCAAAKPQPPGSWSLRGPHNHRAGIRSVAADFFRKTYHDCGEMTWKSSRRREFACGTNAMRRRRRGFTPRR